MFKAMFALLCAAVFGLFTMPSADANVAILCYHEVDKANDDFAVTKRRLEDHVKLMEREGFRFISLDEYIRFTKGELTLPDKSVMLTFDDGYRSFYTKVYPMLKAHNVPAMLAVVSSWTNGDEALPADVRDALSWDELREMETSGLVTVVTHTHAMHKQRAVNPQGSRGPVVGEHLYLNGRYESPEEYSARVGGDLAKVQRLFTEQLGHPARAVVWPYGACTRPAVELAKAGGAEAAFVLDGGVNEPGEDAQWYAKRMIVTADVSTSRLRKLLTVNHDSFTEQRHHLVQVDLDQVVDDDPRQYAANVQALADSLEDNKVDVVALQAFADPDGDGMVDDVYFANGVLPVRADIFSDVATRLQQRGMAVVAWLPVLNYAPLVNDDNAVRSRGEEGWYHRLSPFAKADLAKVNQLFRDLATNTPAAGVLLQDDLYLGEDEDVSAPAQTAYREATGRDLLTDMDDHAQTEQLVRRRVQALDDAAAGAVDAFRDVRPGAVVMRDAYAGAVLDKDAAAWLGQDYDDYLNRYDYTVVMAYPYMDGEPDADAYLRRVAKAVKKHGGVDRTIVKIQAYDWSDDTWVDQGTFTHQLRLLRSAGIRHLGTYPLGDQVWEVKR